MAKSYRAVERDQQFLLPVDMREWLPDGHLAWFLIEAVEQIETAAFHDRHANVGAGRAAFDPDMLVTLLLYAYSRGVRSSRQIERLCEVDVAFRVICAQDVPDHTTIARFRQAHDEAFGQLFTAVLQLAAQAGLGRFGTVAVDGTKMVADASIDVNRDEDWLRAQVRQILAEAAEVDAAEDAEFGDARGDEMPAELAKPDRRRAAIEAALAELEARQQAAAEAAEQAERQAAERARQRMERMAAGERVGPGDPKGIDPVWAARLRLQQLEEAQQAKLDAYAQRLAAAKANGMQRPRGRAPTPIEQTAQIRKARAVLARALERAARREQQPPDPPKRWRVNTTDPDSRVLPTRKGWVQGYNLQIAVTADQLILATRVVQDTNDTDQFVPMMHAAEEAAETCADASDQPARIETLLADAGYLSDTNLTTPGPDRLIALGSGRNQNKAAATTPAEGDPPEDASPTQAMDHRLRTPDGAALYKRRGATVEPAIANLKKMLNRLSRRGTQAATGEINLAAAAFNLTKIHRQAPATG